MPDRIISYVTTDTISRMVNLSLEFKKDGKEITRADLEKAARNFSNSGEILGELLHCLGFSRIKNHYDGQKKAKDRAAADFYNAIKNPEIQNGDTILVNFHNILDEVICIGISVKDDIIALKVQDGCVSKCLDSEGLLEPISLISGMSGKTIKDFTLYQKPIRSENNVGSNVSKMKGAGGRPNYKKNRY